MARAGHVAAWVATLARPEPSRYIGGAARAEIMERRRKARVALARHGLGEDGKPRAQPVTIPRLVLLPGDLLGRVTGYDADGLPRVDRWSGAAPEGWRTHGIEGRPMPAGGPEGHASYAAALARIGEVAT